METKDVVKVIGDYRHDLMNELQMVHGYLSMGKIDKVENKVKECIAFYSEERKLMSLNVPAFALWLIQFNHVHDNFRLTYQIHTENKKLNHFDEMLVRLSNAIIDELKITCDNMELFEIHLELKETSDPLHIEFNFFIEDCFCKLDKIKINEKYMGQVNKLQVIDTTEGKLCKVLIPCNT